MLVYMHLFASTVIPPYKLNIHIVLYCPPFCSVVLFMPPPQNLDSYYFVTLFDFLSLKNYVNVASKRNKEKKLC